MKPNLLLAVITCPSLMSSLSVLWALTSFMLPPGDILSNSVRGHGSCRYAHIRRTSRHVIPSRQRKPRRERSGMRATDLTTRSHRGTNVSSQLCTHIFNCFKLFIIHTFVCNAFSPKICEFLRNFSSLYLEPFLLAEV
jgi:hypothetical protein